MAVPGIGAKSYIQIGKESIYGTAVAATKKIEVVSFDVAPQIGFIEDPSLYNQPSRRGFYQGGLLYQGKITMRLNFEGLLKFFEGVFGSGVTTGAGPYTHTFKEALNLPSYTIELIEGDVATGLEQELVGAKIVDMTIKGTAGDGNDGMFLVECTVLAKDKVVGQTPTGALSYPAVLPALFHQMTTVDEGSDDAASSIRVTDLEVRIENKLAKRFYMGSLTPEEPIRNDFLEVTWRITQEFITTALFAKAKAFTVANLNFIWTSGSRTFTLRSNQANLDAYGNPVENYGIISARSSWRAFYDATDLSALVAIFAGVNESAI